MNYFKFRKKIEELPLFETRELRLILGKEFNKSFLNNLKNWENKEYLIRIRKGLFLPADLKSAVSPMMLAAKIYAPSYVSMESALGYYGIIPEAVFTTTSITARKTVSFTTKDFGKFSYQKIKREAFGGFETHKENNISFNLALPEKALVDFFYLNRNILDGSKKQFASYRFNEEFKYNKKRLVKFADFFKNKKTAELVNKFIKYYVAQ